LLLDVGAGLKPAPTVLSLQRLRLEPSTAIPCYNYFDQINLMPLPKLVRDKIPELIIQNDKKIPVTRIFDDQEYVKELLKKLQEEANEVVESEPGEQRKEELADILEIMKAIAIVENTNLEDIEKIRAKKADERGGFEKKILLEEIK
jgi:predicted house-cleaning noncanonical NTP pyrophosphatase (MazG superfamily)